MDVSSLFNSVMGDGPNPNKVRAADWNELVDALATAPALSADETIVGEWTFEEPLTLARTNGATAAPIFSHDPTITGTVGTASGNVGGTTFATTFQPVAWANGPGGEVNYVDDTWHFGMNVGPLSGGVGRADTSKPNLALSFESKFYSGVFGQEFHLQGVSTDGLTTFRPFTFFIAHDATTVQGAARGHRFTFYGQSGDVIGNFSEETGIAPFSVTAPAESNVAVLVQPTSAAADDRAIQAILPAVTGVSYPFEGYSDATSQGVMRLGNTRTASGDFRIYLTTGGASAGDPYITCEIPGVINWSFGLDNSDSDRFVFSTGSTLGASNVLGLTTGGDVQIYKPLVALGGGSAPTLGTIGGSGPATAAQNTWLRLLDSTGAAFWVPAWK